MAAKVVTETCIYCAQPFQVPYWSDRTHCYGSPCLARASGHALHEAQVKAVESRAATSPTLRRLAGNAHRVAEFRALQARLEYHNQTVSQVSPC